jgi:hypothetical protein
MNVKRPSKRRKCWGCHNKVWLSQAYKAYTNNRDGKLTIEMLLCSKPCWAKYIKSRDDYSKRKYGYGYFELLKRRKEEYKLKEVCEIVQRHDTDMAADPERIDIGKFLRIHIPCIHDKKDRVQ